ncbi:thiocillin family RiPP [Spiractinospora alimapuensis]|uniref:thiocillin family RiPP n=1 Tax=Spiractinospora alimapuensis TaxID=2820884 RepID=UPI001F470895|nr:thiocillin family RiPP [Spiractinospora alimapuensis]QVQ50242.1 thiocillin family RiPP [Spiractinospora alimapuensis]
MHQESGLDLYATEEETLTVEVLPEGNALNSFATVATASSASCPATSAMSFTSATSLSC